MEQNTAEKVDLHAPESNYPGFVLHSEDDNSTSVEWIELARSEYVALKSHLAALRGPALKGAQSAQEPEPTTGGEGRVRRFVGCDGDPTAVLFDDSVGCEAADFMLAVVNGHDSPMAGVYLNKEEYQDLCRRVIKSRGFQVRPA